MGAKSNERETDHLRPLFASMANSYYPSRLRRSRSWGGLAGGLDPFFEGARDLRYPNYGDPLAPSYGPYPNYSNGTTFTNATATLSCLFTSASLVQRSRVTHTMIWSPKETAASLAGHRRDLVQLHIASALQRQRKGEGKRKGLLHCYL